MPTAPVLNTDIWLHNTRPTAADLGASALQPYSPADLGASALQPFSSARRPGCFRSTALQPCRPGCLSPTALQPWRGLQRRLTIKLKYGPYYFKLSLETLACKHSTANAKMALRRQQPASLWRQHQFRRGVIACGQTRGLKILPCCSTDLLPNMAETVLNLTIDFNVEFAADIIGEQPHCVHPGLGFSKL